MPKLGFNMDEGKLVRWYKAENDKVAKGEPLFAIETDKTTIDVEATCDGVVRKLFAKEGDKVPVTLPIAVVGDEGENVSAALAEAAAALGQEAETPAEPAAPVETQTVPAPAPAPTVGSAPAPAPVPFNGKLSITPRARRLAGRKKIELSALAGVAGTGAGGGICEKDVEDYLLRYGPRAGTNARGDIRCTPRARRVAKELDIPLSALSEVEGSGVDGAINAADVFAFAAAYQPGKLSRKKISPVAARIAEEVGLDLSTLTGTGVNGKIMKRDVQAEEPEAPVAPAKEPTKAGEPAAPTHTADGIEIAEVREYAGVRKIIGTRLGESWVQAPHIFFRSPIDMTELLALRAKLNSMQGTKLSVSDFLIKGVSKALEKMPEMNVSLRDGKIYSFKSTNIGLAVAAPGGLIVPVIKEAQKMSLLEVSKESARLVEKARAGKLVPSEYTGGTFSISNTGMFGIDSFTAVVNPPESAILAVAAIIDKPVAVAQPDGTRSVEIRPIMNITLTADHRVIDGAAAAKFVKILKEVLEQPLQILL